MLGPDNENIYNCQVYNVVFGEGFDKMKTAEMLRHLSFLFIVFLLLIFFQMNKPLHSIGGEQMEITSSAFEEGQMIPKKYTCDDVDISPPIKLANVPEGAKTIALICDDPDAPVGTWVHWVLFNLPANITELPEKVPPDEVLSNGAKQGTSDFGRIGYGGPCPPSGTHRYYFKVYSLDKELDLKPGATKAELLKAMEGHIVAEGQLMGKYKRQ
jgi:Raf kinase inhibitor-like YbhB/YbcL family protein